MRLARILASGIAGVLLAAPTASSQTFSEMAVYSDTAFVTVTLGEAIDRAKANSPRIEQLRELETAADARHREARGARYPELEITAGYMRTSDVPELTIPIPGGGTRTLFPNIPDNYRTRATLSLPLYTGGRLAATAAAARWDREAAGKNLEAATGDLVLETATAYWELVTSRADERVLEEALRSYEAHLADARNREKVGIAARSEVLAVEVERDRAELVRLRAANDAAIANENLGRLLGVTPGTRVEPADLLEGSGIAGADLEDLVAAAMEARPERAHLLARSRAAESMERAAKSGWLPAVGLVAGFDEAKPNREILPPEERWEDTWDVSVNLAWKLFDGGRTGAAVARNRALARAAKRELEDFDRKVRLEVTARFLDLRTAEAAVAVADRALESATENRKVTRDRYVEGVSPSSEMLDAEVALLRAGLDRSSALANLRLAAARVDRAVGR